MCEPRLIASRPKTWLTLVEICKQQATFPDDYGRRLTDAQGRWSAYVFGARKDEVFLKLKELLEPFGIKRYCTDGWGAYSRHLPAELHEVGKRMTQLTLALVC